MEIPQIPLAIEDLPLGLHVRHYQSVTEIPSGETTIMAHQICLYETRLPLIPIREGPDGDLSLQERGLSCMLFPSGASPPSIVEAFW